MQMNFMTHNDVVLIPILKFDILLICKFFI